MDSVRQLRAVSDERDEALAQDWKRVEQLREEKALKERLQNECGSLSECHRECDEVSACEWRYKRAGSTLMPSCRPEPQDI